MAACALAITPDAFQAPYPGPSLPPRTRQEPSSIRRASGSVGCPKMSSHPFRITEELSEAGQRTPSGQRCWRTSAKHLASSIRPERLTKSDAGMMAETPRASRLAARASAITPDTLQPHHPHPPPRNPTRASPRMTMPRLGNPNLASMGHQSSTCQAAPCISDRRPWPCTLRDRPLPLFGC